MPGAVVTRRSGSSVPESESAGQGPLGVQTRTPESGAVPPVCETAVRGTAAALTAEVMSRQWSTRPARSGITANVWPPTCVRTFAAPPTGHRRQTRDVLPSNTSAITAILLALVPGFVATSVWARARTWKGHTGVSDLRTILQSLALSLVVQVVISPLTITLNWPVRTHLGDYPERVAAWLGVSVLVVPFTMGLVGPPAYRQFLSRSDCRSTASARY